jgi:iron(III) transport system ATP-binding protein
VNEQRAAVAFRGVSKRYGDVVAVDDVDFSVQPGTLVTLLGPSGCGKTTTLRMVAGLEMASSGQIFIDGEDVTQVPATERDVTMVFQSYALFPHMSVLDNVAYGPLVSGASKREAHSRARDSLTQVGLEALAERLPSELSGGQQQRVAVARAVVLRPRVLLFDEPLSNLDAKLRRRVREEIRELQQALSLTALYVTHDQQEALAVSDQIIVMRAAGIAQMGTPRELYTEPADRFVADFIGDANLLPGRVLSVQEAIAEVDIGGLTCQLSSRGCDLGSAEVAIRPESVALVPACDSDQGLIGTIRRATYLGSHVEYEVETAVGQLYVKDHATDIPMNDGVAVKVTIRPGGTTLVGNIG